MIWDWNACDRGGHPSTWVRSWTIWKYFRDYFPITLVKTCDLPPGKNYLLGYHPHGIMCAGAFGNFATEGTGFSELFPNIRPHLLVLKGQFRFPIHRDLLLSAGICASTPKSIDFILGAKQQDKGNAAVLVVGGAIEVLDAHPGSYRLYLSRRKGFVRKALQHGASLVPVLSFGENELFVQASNPEGTLLRRCQAWLTRRFGFAPPIFHGRGVFQYSCGWLPFRKPIVTVVGAPLEVAKIEDPSVEEVNALHEKYTSALSRLFEDHKDLYAAPGAQLCIA
ncbi:unnamed protein product [Ixodes persulcatus]